VKLTLLVTPDCPHAASAAALLRTALDDVGLTGATFTTTVVATAEEATRIGFIGSPTILVDGEDPFAVPGARPGLACRIYSSPHRPDRHPSTSGAQTGAEARRCRRPLAAPQCSGSARADTTLAPTSSGTWLWEVPVQASQQGPRTGQW
jgi:hypothetical protein